MPKKKKGTKGKGKGKKGKGGKKAAAKAAAAAETEEMLRTCHKFVRIYQSRCAASCSTASQRICKDFGAYVETERPLAKFILDLPEPARRRSASTKTPSKSPNDLPQPPDPTQPAASPTPAAPHTAAESSAGAGPLLQPLVETWRELNYHYLRCLHVWNLHQGDEAIVSLALFIESSLGPNIKVLELRNTGLSPWSIGRLARSMASSQLAVLNLDYNRFSQPDVSCLCTALHSCQTLHSLSLNYCHLNTSCADPFGTLAAATQIKHLSLAGNSLLCEGATELIKALVIVCESDAEYIPPLARLNLQDNGIDCSGPKGMIEPVMFIRMLKRWLLCSPVVEDVNLDSNWIGDAGARELVLALQQRKQAGLSTVAMKVTTRISSEFYSSIVELGTPGKKKGKKSKKKKK